MAFGPRTDGQVLGVNYDTVDMTWYLTDQKLNIILLLIQQVMEEGEATARVFKKLCGKLVDIRDLIIGAKFHLAHLIMAATVYSDKQDMEEIAVMDEWLKSDLRYFSLVLPVYSRRTKLQDPDRRPAAWAVRSHTDSAGGSETIGRGVGMTIFPNIWTYVPWGKRINEGWRAYDGKRLSNKMSAWELVGPLLTVSCTGNTLSGKQVEVFVDNDGSVQIWNKGWTTKCDLCNTLILAIHQVSTGLNIELFISGISRCSSKESEACDALSKCEMKRFLSNMPEADITPKTVPTAILTWLENPVPDRNLGDRILKELSKTCEVLNY